MASPTVLGAFAAGCCGFADRAGLLFVTCPALALAGFGPQHVVFGLAFAVYAMVAFRLSWFREATRWPPRRPHDGFGCYVCYTRMLITD